MVTKIYIKDYLIDLFEDETMELNSSIANTDDITKINSDYTKTFTVPASERNNYLFKHYYDADIDNSFDARIKQDARIEIDGYSFKTGKIRLEKVSVKNNQPSAYTINFWGNLVNFKELLKDDELSSLDFSDLEHEYTSDNVKLGLTTGLFGGDIVYNLLSPRRQYLYDTTVGNNTDTSTLVNIAYNGNDRGVIWNELKPSIRLLSIIEAIENKYSITFTRQFFDRAEFSNLYMWVNASEEKKTAPTLVDFDGGNNTYVNFTTDTLTVTTYLNNANDGFRLRYKLIVTPAVSYEAVPYKVIVKNNGVVVSETSAVGTYNPAYVNISSVESTEHNYTFEISSETNFKFTTILRQNPNLRILGSWQDAGTGDTTSSEQELFSFFNVSMNMPKLKIVDFLKGIFSMFKLVAIPNEQNEIYINNISNYYQEGRLIDLSNYVNFENYDVERGKINNQIDFKYQEPTTILNSQFKQNTGIAYGDELLTLADEYGVILDGEKLEVVLPFEQVLFERLTNLEDNVISNIQYGLIVNPTLEPVKPKPLIYYNNLVQLDGNQLSFINESGDAELIDTTINTPAHTFGFNAPEFSILWGVEFSTWDYSAINGTLFYNYWRQYISDIFNIKRRNFKFDIAYLPSHILTTIQLNDVIFIKERYYRINDYVVNLNTRSATLNLINSFEINLGLFLPSSRSIYLNYLLQTYIVSVSNGSVMNITLEDLGFGTSWANVIQIGSNIEITVLENELDTNRDMFINVDNGDGKSFQIYLNQDNLL